MEKRTSTSDVFGCTRQGRHCLYFFMLGSNILYALVCIAFKEAIVFIGAANAMPRIM